MKKLSDLRKQVQKLNREANLEYKGKFFSIPTSILEESDSSYVSMCQVIKVDLQENSVELSYEADGENDLWTAISIQEFEKHAKADKYSEPTNYKW